MSITVYAGNVQYGSEWVKDKPPYKHWDNMDNLKSNSNPAYCVKSGSVATRNGTYNTPAPLVLNQFNFNITDGTKIKKVIVHYSQQKFSLSRSQKEATFPSFGGATFTLLGTGQSKVGEAVSSKYTAYTLEFTGISLDKLKSSDFGLKIAYPRNNSTNTGNMCLGNVCLEIITEEPTVILSLDTDNNNPVVNDRITINCHVERVNKDVKYNPLVYITLPGGVSFVSSAGHGTVTSDTSNVYRWESSFENRDKNTISLVVDCTMKGEFTVNITDSLTGKSSVMKINIREEVYKVSTSLYDKNKPHVVGTNFDYNITLESDYNGSINTELVVELPASVTVNNTSVLTSEYGLVTNTTSNDKRILTFQVALNKKKVIPFNIYPSSSMYNVQNIYINNKLYLTTPLIAIPTSYESLGFTRLLIPEDYTGAMGNQIQYVFTSIARYIIDNTTNDVLNYKNNLRIGIYNSSTDYLTDEDDFLKHVQWCNNITTKKWAEYKCTFTYNQNNPLYLVYSHDYVGNPLYEDIHLDFTQAAITEKIYDGLYDTSKKYPIPLSGLLNSTEFAKVKMDKRSSTAPVIVYNWAGADAFKTEDVSIRGITLNLTYAVTNDVEIMVTLSADGDNTIHGYRNRTLHKGSGTLTLGGNFDLFGLTPHDLRGKADQLTIEVEVNNPYDANVEVELNDVNLQVNYIVIHDSYYGFEINGERSEEYGLYFTEMTHNLGTKNEISEYHIEGADRSIVNRMNIKPKEIDIELAIDECDIADEIALADDVISKLFTNKRNVLTNKPTPKYIIFDHMPDKRYWFIRKDEIDDKIDKDTYIAKIKLYIPSGTAEVIPAVITGSNGATNGLISIEPLIHLQSTNDGQIQLSENNTEQSLLVTDSSIKVGDLITVDNENRRVTRRPVGSVTDYDITNNVDFSTTWFKLRGEYNFTSSTAIITDVEFHDRK